jgi:hypothetical protein
VCHRTLSIACVQDIPQRRVGSKAESFSCPVWGIVRIVSLLGLQGAADSFGVFYGVIQVETLRFKRSAA